MNFFDFLFNNQTDIPEKPFLLGKEEMAFKELFKKSSILSAFLQKHCGRNKNIILCSPNSSFFLITYLGIIKSGNICIPIDPSITQDNFNYIADETSPEIVFKSINSRIDTEFFKKTLIDENYLKTILSNSKLEDLEKRNDSDLDFYSNIAEIIFTSGSTGKPKGVVLTHGNLISNTASIIEYLKLKENDRVLVVMPFYYCYGLSLLHTHLKCQGSIVINSSFIFLGGVINDLLQYQCTGFAGVPSHFQILLRKTKTFTTTSFPHLRYVTQAGGKLHNTFIEEFCNEFKDIQFYVMYGQTEATARLSYLPPDKLKSKLGSIGKGIPGVTLRVVDNSFNEIQPGETGEIIAKGDNIMLGYYKDEKLTRQTIHEGWLRTGDLATIDNEGYIFLIARAKEIFKIRGKKVSPKEIESVISLMKEVVDCSISAFYDELEGESLEARIVLKDECKNLISEKDILSHCRQHLELFKIPSKITFLDKMMINGVGKKVIG